MNRDRVSQILQPRRRLQRGHAAQHQVDQQRGLDFAGDPLDLVDALRRLDEDDVRARPRVPVGPLDGGVEPQRRAGVGAGHHEHVVVRPGVQGRV